jgi:hypothetical protein
VNELCVSDWLSCQVPAALWSDAVCNTIETTVLRQASAVCVADASDIKEHESDPSSSEDAVEVVAPSDKFVI